MLTKLMKRSLRKQCKSYGNGDWLVGRLHLLNKLEACAENGKIGVFTWGSDCDGQKFERHTIIGGSVMEVIQFGLACEGMKPVVAIYSTFLQRAYDQLIHDVAIQNLDVLFAIDRAGLLEDGPTHSGVYDHSFLRTVPNLIIMTPSNEFELNAMLELGYDIKGPVCVRYPRGSITGQTPPANEDLILGQGIRRRLGRQIAILAFGSMVSPSLEAADLLDATVVDMRFVKPLDQSMINDIAASHEFIVTIEENAIQGGAGSGVNEYLAAAGYRGLLLNLGVPDAFIEPDKPENMLSACGLDIEGIVARISAHREAFLG